jgi:hypothetical protein
MKKNSIKSKRKDFPVKRFNEFTAMKEQGFNFKGSQDEFSYQPDSGSTSSGRIGQQEYGINIDLDANGSESSDAEESPKVEDPTRPIPGESEWSQSHRLPGEESTS